MSAHPATARAEAPEPVHIGEHLRQWRLRRHLSQLDLAEEAEISTRHLSFVENRTRGALARHGVEIGRTA